MAKVNRELKGLKKLRDCLKLSQEQLAHLANVPKHHIVASELERAPLMTDTEWLQIRIALRKEALRMAEAAKRVIDIVKIERLPVKHAAPAQPKGKKRKAA